MAISYKDSLKELKTAMSTASTMSIRSVSAESYALSADEGFEKLESTQYDWIDQYTDEKYSTVDENKNVKISDGQVNITAEENSQVIPFELPRRYDNIDLSTMFFQIHYVTSQGYEGLSTPINVMISDEKIRFYWLLDGSCTTNTGLLAFEIIATGTVTYTDAKGNESAKSYIWKTKPNKNGINILESLSGNGQGIEPAEGWIVYLQQVSDKVTEATAAAAAAQAAAEKATEALTDVDTKINDAASEISDQVKEEIQADLDNFLTKEEYNTNILSLTSQVADNTSKISEINTTKLPDLETKINSVESTNATALSEYRAETDSKIQTNTDAIAATNESLENNYYNKTTIDELLTNVQVDLSDYYNKEETDNLLKNVQVDLTGYYTKTETDSLLSSKADKSTVSTISEKISSLEDAINDANTDPTVRYTTTYDATTGEFILWEITMDENDEEVQKEVSKHIIVGGGGSSSSTTITITRITSSTLTITKNDKAVIEYEFSSIDSSGEDTGEGVAVWKLGNSVLTTTTAIQGKNSIDLTEYLSVGKNNLTLSITDAAGALSVKTWTVHIVDLYLESSFNDRYTYPLGTISFDYTPYGAIEKTVYFILDGEEIGTVTTSASGLPLSYELPAQEHGAHLLEVYATAELNNDTIETNHIFKDILWYDETSEIPVIGTISQDITVKQYDSENIVYTVYDPKTSTPTVEIAIDNEVVSTVTMETPTSTYQFKTAEIGEHILTITCGETVKTIKILVEELDIDVTPITANLAFDFNPVGYSNSSADRLWSNGDVTMTVSDNFDWVNGGYQYDENGDQYFCIKAGTTAEINHLLFSGDIKKNGKEFKLVFKTTNVAKPDTTFLSCIENITDSTFVGLRMDADKACVYGQANYLELPYSEEDIIEFEFNIDKMILDDDGKIINVPKVMGYEDGVSTRPMVYDGTYEFTQISPKTIVLGSSDCDLHIYRFKVYDASLSDRDILNNFIADARNAEEMISRYDRNQIYDENQALNPDVLAEKCPWLRVYKLSAPYFTNNKSDKVPNTTIQQVYKNGDSILDNWTCYNAQHSGQGTSANNYGAAGRNLDFIMNKSGVDGVDPYFILGDGVTRATEITLSRTSVPVAYLNAKVNIASSNNMTNAMLANRYYEFDPYKRPFIREEGVNTTYIKDTMEFYNCVIFIKETNEDISTHREFADTSWHKRRKCASKTFTNIRRKSDRTDNAFQLYIHIFNGLYRESFFNVKE